MTTPKRGEAEMSPSPAGPGLHHEKKFEVRPFEVSSSGRIKLIDLLNYFQEAAGEHAEKLGFSVTHLAVKNLTWVLSRYHVRILRYPAWKEDLSLETWPSIRQGLFALREFELKDSQKNLLAAATSSWMMIDVRSKRPVNLSAHLADFSQDGRRAVADDFAALPTIAKSDFEMPFRVRFHDLDWNRHVNHTVYIEWAVETVPRDILVNFVPAEIEVDFRGEALLGQSVVSRAEAVRQEEEAVFHHQIWSEDGGKELTRLRTLWQKNP
jgi:medium-chain acyl-[acyl-carrier-protein] hydrolase